MIFNPFSEAAKEKIEELTVDLDIIKTEMDGGDGVSAGTAGSGQAGEGAGGAVTNYELKHLQAQVNGLCSGFTDAGIFPPGLRLLWGIFHCMMTPDFSMVLFDAASVIWCVRFSLSGSSENHS